MHKATKEAVGSSAIQTQWDVEKLIAKQPPTTHPAS